MIIADVCMGEYVVTPSHTPAAATVSWLALSPPDSNCGQFNNT